MSSRASCHTCGSLPLLNSPQLHASLHKSVGASAEQHVATLQGAWHEPDNPCGAVGKVVQNVCVAHRGRFALSASTCLFHLRAAACRVGLLDAGDREPEWPDVARDRLHDRGPLHDAIPAVLRHGWQCCEAQESFPEELRVPTCQSYIDALSQPQACWRAVHVRSQGRRPDLPSPASEPSVFSSFGATSSTNREVPLEDVPTDGRINIFVTFRRICELFYVLGTQFGRIRTMMG